MRAGQPDEAPAPWHDPICVVAAATGRQPATPGKPVREPIDQPGRLAHRGRGHAQMRQRIPRVRIGAVLRHDEVRPERGGQFGEQDPDRAEPRPFPGLGLERHVHRRAGPGQQQGMAVRLRLGPAVRRHVSAGADRRLDDHRLAQGRLQPIGEKSRERVRRGSRREADEDLDGRAWILGLPESRTGSGRK